MPMNSVVKVGVAGQGRSGFGIHVKTLEKLQELYQVVAVADPIADRRLDAPKVFPGCKAYGSAEELIADPEVELLVVATPSHLHTPHTLAGLRGGKKVLCEKPVALSLADFDAAVAEAKDRGQFFAAFQQRRYEPSLAKIKEVVAAGTLGEVAQVRVVSHAFSRRWDWQTMKQFGGGQLYNNCPHLIDLGLQLFGPKDPTEIFCDLRKTLAAGDAEDHVKITLKAPGQPTLDLEWTHANPYPQDMWLVMGTAGGLKGTTGVLDWKYVDWSKHPPRKADPKPTEGRTYNSEKLTFQEGHWEAPKGETPIAVRFYQDLHTSIRDGKPPVVTMESIRRQIAIIDHCRKACPV